MRDGHDVEPEQKKRKNGGADGEGEQDGREADETSPTLLALELLCGHRGGRREGGGLSLCSPALLPCALLPCSFPSEDPFEDVERDGRVREEREGEQRSEQEPDQVRVVVDPGQQAQQEEGQHYQQVLEEHQTGVRSVLPGEEELDEDRAEDPELGPQRTRLHTHDYSFLYNH